MLDVGHTLTHKTVVGETSLSGTSTQEIARRIYHSPRALDRYLKTFHRLLVLRHFRLPKRLMVQVTGHSLSLIEEHRVVADKHLSTGEALTQYVISRRLDLKEAG